MSDPELVTYYFIAVNFTAFVLYGVDKIKAQRGAWRITEDTLIGVVFLGGLLGALAGRAAFRHKTRKKGFATKLWIAAAANIAMVVGGALHLSNADTPRGAHEQSWSQPYR